MALIGIACIALIACGGSDGGHASTAKSPLQEASKKALALTPSTSDFRANGWYWDPQAGGTGFMFEAQGDSGFIAFFLYEAGTGKPVWYCATGQFIANSDGSFSFTGDLGYYTKGQSVYSPVYRSPNSVPIGTVRISFSGGGNASVQLPGRHINATRYDFGGLSGTPSSTQPEVGWYWNPSEGGRGYAIEVQNDKVFFAMFHYNDDGTPTWNVVEGNIGSGVVTNPFQLYYGGQTLVSEYVSPKQRFDLGSFTISFRNPCAGQVQLAGIAPVSIRRFVFGNLAPGAECRTVIGGIADVPASLDGVARLEPGDSMYGVIDWSGDVDSYGINLVAGVSYRFGVQGAVSGVGTLPAPALQVRDMSWQLAAANGLSGELRDATVQFTPTVSGIHYLSVKDGNAGTGRFLLWTSGVATGLASQPIPPLGSYAGTVSGVLTGRQQGTFTVTVDGAGKLSGTALLPKVTGAAVPVSGNVIAGGVVHFTTVGIAGTAMFDGYLGPAGDLSGTWSDFIVGPGGVFVGERTAPVAPAPAPAPTAGIWSKVTDERGAVVVSEQTTVRFGAESQWLQKVVSGRLECSIDFFGSDPAPGWSKQCDALETGVAPVLAPLTLPLGTWSQIATEGGTYTLTGQRIVRYGSGASWLVRQDSGTSVCNKDNFSGDPMPSAAKLCMVFTPTVATVATTAVGGGPNIDVSKLPPSGNFATNVLRVAPSSEAPAVPLDGVAAFRVWCPYSHMAFDDPIVKPGQPGASHLHAFFGNTATNGNSTVASIATAGNSTCVGGIANRSAYWAPAIIDTLDGTPVMPNGSLTYYKSTNIKPSLIQPMPAGLRMIAGDSKNATSTGPFDFNCAGPNSGSGPYRNIPNCKVGEEVVIAIEFPQCWDGVNLDSPDHKSHMAYPSGSSCPSTHPVAIPQIGFHIGYTVKEAGAALRWRFSSDNYSTSLPGGYSAHADWFNGWDPSIMNLWVKNCLQAGLDCHGDQLGDGRALY